MERRRHNTRHAAALAAAAVMDDSFQAWALRTYGDSAKTKTVTRRKYNRILRILKGEEQTSAENSKFRFWVKAKGFRVGPADQVLYIPCSKMPNNGGDRSANVVYKKVAVVENFYDIIYGVHVEMDGRGGKHAGQKRTYKAIAETYSFLPREAVTHFLMSCADCQKRMHLGHHDNESSLDTTAGDDGDSLHIDYSLPITTTYLKHMRSLGYSEEDALNPDREDSEDGESGEETPAAGPDAPAKEESPAGPSGRRRAVARHRKSPMQWSDALGDEPLNMTQGAYSTDHSLEGSPGAKREAGTPDTLSAGTKDDDDEDDDDDADKIDINKYDPERLKAFNMFVRLFVDENLDRMTPISRQPKDKIQAIIDSCARQFPEFGERARKRIRTYLKSCRRNKRAREGPELGRNPQPHLTSALAEQILANACENESQNAKRMRLGLKPIAAEVERASPHESTFQSTLRPGKASLSNGTQSSPYTSPYRLVPNASTNGHSAASGPTDLSLKKGPALKPSEVLAVRQLIAGYRESAAFLLRSADELEQLLLQQN